MASVAPFNAGAMQLLTDGRVIFQESSTEQWWQLVPDDHGSYDNGTWSELARMPTGYTPLYTATGLLPDGKVIVEGGEYLGSDPVWTNQGALYDPATNSWERIIPPLGWTTIGDASGMTLADNRFLLSNCCTDQLAVFDPKSTTWIPIGTGKRDINDEESWAQLWDDTILTVDANNLTNLQQAEIFTPSTGEWTSAGDVPIEIADTNPDNSGSHEVGPEIVMPNGEVLAMGGNGHNVVYSQATKTWRQTDDLPLEQGQQLDVADGPGAILPNGTALIAASPGFGNSPTHFYEWDGTSFTRTDEPPDAPFAPSFVFFMVVLPTGEILMTDGGSDVELYTPAPGISPNAVPVITRAPTAVDPTAQPFALDPVATLIAGKTYTLEADRINGISQGAYYGDDQQAYTNFPLVRITNDATGKVRYCRTHDHAHRKIGPDSHGATQFDIPADIDLGPSSLETVANGIASTPLEVNLR